jgi:antitoxin ParD1/3/4
MTTMNISLPDSMKAYVDQRVSQEGYGTSSEYVRELIRRDKDRSQLRAMMLKGLESPVAGQADAAYFQTLRKRAEQRKKA